MKLKRMNWAPYLLILPSFLYLMLFFGWPMIRSLELAFRRDSQILSLSAEIEGSGGVSGRLEKGTVVEIVRIVDIGGSSAAGGLLSNPEYWYEIKGPDLEGNEVSGWAERGPIGVSDVKVSSAATVKVADTPLYESPDAASAVLTSLAVDTQVAITGWQDLEPLNADGTWTRIQVGLGLDRKAWWVPTAALDIDELAGEACILEPATPLRENPYADSPVQDEIAAGETVVVLPPERKSAPHWFAVTVDDSGQEISGWVQRDAIAIIDPVVSTVGRVEAGTGAKEWTLDYFKRMFRDRNFKEALQTTILLMILILPLQFTLAIVMALVLQARPRFSMTFLYIYSIPLGISDLAAGLVFYSIFTQKGFLNTVLEQLGLIDKPFVFISYQNKEWIIVAIVLAEMWRATSIVMVIVVSGLQAIPGELLEAGELFGASLWQRLRHIILPLLKPSLQVALILRTILAFQVFAVVIAISGGDVVTVLANETYRWYDVGTYNNPHVAAAYAGFIMVISLVVAVIYLRTVRSQEERLAE